ncbi:dUTP diphosphatase [Geobacillus phage vB_GthS_PT9.1]|nr:dUTP diphosphatase [Geobacillus phage vB_GthS_PT9.1]
MNIKPLFEIQRRLDERIIKEHGLEGKYLFDHKLMALKVELGELANEWGMFKFWKKNPQPRTRALRKPVMMPEDQEWYNPLLEELVDVMHFLLSLGLERGWDRFIDYIDYKPYMDLLQFENLLALFENSFISSGDYCNAWKHFLSFGRQLGFTEQEILDAYMEKNRINHARQESGVY